MLKKIAQAFSILFHPIFMPVFGLLLIYNSGTYIQYLAYELKKPLFLIILINTVVVPICLMPIYLYQKIIRKETFNETQNRIIPLVVMVALYFFTWYLLFRIQVNGFQVPGVISIFILSSAITALVTTVVTLFYRISLHMIGIGGLVGATIGLMARLDTVLTPYILVLILVAGIVGTSRLLLEEHEPHQVYSGFLSGFSVVLILFLWIGSA